MQIVGREAKAKYRGPQIAASVGSLYSRCIKNKKQNTAKRIQRRQGIDREEARRAQDHQIICYATVAVKAQVRVGSCRSDRTLSSGLITSLSKYFPDTTMRKIGTERIRLLYPEVHRLSKAFNWITV